MAKMLLERQRSGKKRAALGRFLGEATPKSNQAPARGRIAYSQPPPRLESADDSSGNLSVRLNPKIEIQPKVEGLQGKQKAKARRKM
jgi:hypothetical protein